MKATGKLTLGSAAVILSCLLSSCDPSAFSMNVEMRYPSKSGLDLSGKSVAVVYLEDDPARDSVFNEYLANGFASSLEKEYFGGDQAVGLYRLAKNNEGDYSDEDTLARIVMDTGNDVVFLFDAPDFGTPVISHIKKTDKTNSDGYAYTLPLKLRLYAYDSMGGKDTVRVWDGKRDLTSTLSVPQKADAAWNDSMLWSSLGSQGTEVGEQSASIFLPSWKTEQFTIIYFEGSNSWNEAALYASEYYWKEAAEIWMELAESNNAIKRSCAAYNLGVACFMLGDKALALKWLDSSDADYPLSVTKTLRKKIQEYSAK